MRTYILLLCMSLLPSLLWAAPGPRVSGFVTDEQGRPLPGASVLLVGTQVGTLADARGNFSLQLPEGAESLTASFIGYVSQTLPLRGKGEHLTLRFYLQPLSQELKEVEVFGAREKQPEKMDDITRLPLHPSEQIQSISVLSDRLIAQQGALTISDVARNVAGVNTFATYGGTTESISARGFRGLPVLKNGVRVHSDFRGQGFLTDMQGVESMQVIRGSASITQGVGNDIGSAGGVVNIATKTPKFYTGGEVSLRLGSWGQFRPTFDVQHVLDKEQKLAFRLNGAYERADNFRVHVGKDRLYVNPSLAWRPDDRTTVVLEMDYMHDSRTPDRGTVNLAADSVEALYDMPHDKFLGFATDRVFTENLTYSARMRRKLNDKLSLRVAFMGSTLDTDNTSASTSTLKNVATTGAYNLRTRSIGRSQRADDNQVLQIDLLGEDVHTGKIRHTFQVGMDFRRSKVATTAYKAVLVDTIDVLGEIGNRLPSGISLSAQTPEQATSYSYGLLAQDVISIGQRIKAVLGLRYSYGSSFTATSSQTVSGDAWNPLLGVIFTPAKGVQLFGSYTSTTDLRSAANLMEDGSPIGEAKTEQFEAGVKTQWMQDRLRFNATYFHLFNDNLAYQLYDDNWVSTGRYAKAGNLMRQGVEVELAGRPLPNLDVMLGYSYLDARYQDSPAYEEGSAPMNAPTHTANAWVNYRFTQGAVQGLTLGMGAYYVGARPVNDYTKKATHTNTQPGVKPFDMPAYTTLNLKVGYERKAYGISVFANNIANARGYTSYYRGGYINPIDPFNMSMVLSYRF